MATAKGGLKVAIKFTPQAEADTLYLSEDDLADGSAVADQSVLDNDLGGTAARVVAVLGGDQVAVVQASLASYVDLVTGAPVSPASLAASVAHGAVELDVDGNVTFTSTEGFESLVHGEEFDAGTFTYIIRLGNGAFSVTTAKIIITGTNDAPEIISDGGGDTAAVDVAENTTTVTTVVAEDPDDADLTYSITGGADAGLFDINAATGEVTFKAAPDFDNPGSADGDNVYEIIVTVSDGTEEYSLSDSQTLTITVTNEDEVAPEFDSGDTATTLAENSGPGQTVYTAAATDTDFNPPATAASVTYSLRAVGDFAAFGIDSGTGAVTLTGDPDYETQNAYSFTVIATDAAGNESEQAVSLAITNEDEAPPNSAPTGIAFLPTSTTQANPVGHFVMIDPDAGDSISNVTISNIVNIADGNALTIDGNSPTVAFNSTTGTWDLSGSPATGPNASITESTFTVTVYDQAGASTSAQFALLLGANGNSSDTLPGVLTLLSGNNIESGLNANDTLSGSSGVDYILGNAQDDVMQGNGGADVFLGGGGNDTFKYNATSDSSAAGYDTILDFTSGDKINLSAIDAIFGGLDNGFGFVAAQSNSAVAGQITWYQVDLAGTVDDQTIVQAQVAGAGTLEIHLTGLYTLTGSDFVV